MSEGVHYTICNDDTCDLCSIDMCMLSLGRMQHVQA